MNIWTFTANLGKDAEQRFTSEGTSVVSFSAAVKAGFGKNESTTWANCNVWGKMGESLLPYLKKGQQVAISGEVSIREWEKDGIKNKSLDVRVNSLDLIGGKKDDKPADKPAAKPQGKPAGGESFGDFSDDIPFLNIGRGLSFHVI